MNDFIISHLKSTLHLSPDLVNSQLYDDSTFYAQFLKDVKNCHKEVIIESPFIASYRMASFISVFERLVHKKVKVYVFTRNPEDHDITLRVQAEQEIRRLQTLGVQVILSNDYSHRKLAILDRKILWEGSLNILSQNISREIMRRIGSEVEAKRCFEFINLGKFIY
ncbi:hypothetical protein HGA88_01830 [Candidatus Roizmanbacteria bacterium]|nr:hypothetical protein [Candidatus Roizmanbacteria bacterium]